MNPLEKKVAFDSLPRLGPINVQDLWASIPLTPIDCNVPLLEHYIERHDQWTEKIRIIGLDAGFLVDYRLLPGLDRLIDRLYGQCGWARPEIYVVSDIGRKGIDGWSAVSVVSRSKPVMLLGTHLVENLDEIELAFIIGHETGHLASYTGDWRRQMSLSFLIREYIESDRQEVLQRMDSSQQWETIYRKIMENFRNIEMRCDRLGLLLCRDCKRAANALLTATLKAPGLARNIDLDQYLAVHLPLLSGSPAAQPFSVNAGHPFVPYRLKSLVKFVKDGSLDHFLRINAQ